MHLKDERYDFNVNYGNKTAEHLVALKKYWPGPEHREPAHNYYREYLEGLEAGP